jgi:hypothetical protein
MRLGLGVSIPGTSSLVQAAFSPLDLSPVLWLDASAESSITAADGAWLDGSGLVLPGLSGNYASTPDSAALSITGDIDIKAKVALDDWTPATTSYLAAKWNAPSNDRSYGLAVNTSGQLIIVGSTAGTSGTASVIASSSVSTGLSDGEDKWVRGTIDVDDGSGNRVAKFYLSDDGTTWTQLGAVVTSVGTTSFYDGAAVFSVGAADNGTGAFVYGTVYRVIIQDAFDTADNTTNVVFDADFAAETAGTLSFTEDSTNAATVTLTTTYGQVSQWDDLSGSGNDVVQATAANQPKSGRRALNSLNVLDFDGTSDFIKRTAYIAALTQPLTMFVVASQDVSGSDVLVDSGSLSPRIYFWYAGGIYETNAGATLRSTENVDTNPHVHRLVYNSTSSAIVVDGVTVASGDAGANGTDGITLGSSYAGSSGYWDGAIAEVIVVDGTLTAGQIAATEQYLANKWGITL